MAVSVLFTNISGSNIERFFYFKWMPKPYGMSQKRFAGVGFDGKKRSLISLKQLVFVILQILQKNNW